MHDRDHGRRIELRRVAAGGFTLASDSVDLPIEDQRYPDGPHADVINANCTACHSASRVLIQPPSSADQWKAEVTKMRETYKAPMLREQIAHFFPAP